MSSPEIIFYQGLRCTKVLRQPRATPTSTATSSESSATSEEATAPTSLSTTEPTGPIGSSTDDFASTSSTRTTSATSTSSSDTSSTHHGHQTLQLHPPSSASLLVNQATLVTKLSTATPTTTSSLEPSPHDPGSEGTASPLAAILGGVLGGLGLTALISLLCFLLFRRYRRRRTQRRSAGSWSFGGSERLLRDGRASADSTSSRREYQSGMSFLSQASPRRSLYNFIVGGVNHTVRDFYQDQMSSHQSNPFSDSAEISNGTESSIVPIMIRRSLANADANTCSGPSTEQPEMSQPSRASVSSPLYYDIKRPESIYSSDSGSIRGSQHSLGSTLVLPGGSSAGSSLHRRSFPFPMPPSTAQAQEPTIPREATVRENTRDRTRSNPFDLDLPQFPDSQRSSGTIPIALL